MSPSEEEELSARILPKPESCGYECELRHDHLVITIRSGFDSENSGRSWASDIIKAYRLDLDRIEVNFSRCTIVSSTVFAGLIELKHGFESNAKNGVFLVDVGKQVLFALKTLYFDKLFTVRLRGS